MTAQEADDDRTPWIKIRISLPKHRKIMKLKELLNLHSRQEALGVVVDLLTLTFVHYWADGDWSKSGAPHLEDLLDWRGKEGDLYSALHDCGFLENGKVRGWRMHQNRLIGVRERHYEKSGRPIPNHDPNETRLRAKAAIAARRVD